MKTNLDGPTRKINGEVFQIVYRKTKEGARELLTKFPCMGTENGKAIRYCDEFKMWAVYLKLITNEQRF